MKKTNILMILTLICVLITLWNSLLFIYSYERVRVAELRAGQAEKALAEIRKKFITDYDLFKRGAR